MSFVYVPGETIEELLARFPLTDFTRIVPKDKCNLVLINPKLYEGSYGGIFKTKCLSSFQKPYLSSTLVEGFDVVWWKMCSAPIVGNMTLTYEKRVAVPVQLYSQLKYKNMVYKPYCSYLRPNCINFRSSENSDSE